MIRLIRTNSGNSDFRELVVLLDNELAEKYGSEQSFYAPFNKIDSLRNVVVAYKDDKPAGCGAFKFYSDGIAEVKRMYVHPDCRNKGIAAQVLTELEQWAHELQYHTCILETGKKQPAAIRLYEKAGYTLIPNYGQYKNASYSICMEKML
jgi:GNAT superfamily N-acetyltransferase